MDCFGRVTGWRLSTRFTPTPPAAGWSRGGRRGGGPRDLVEVQGESLPRGCQRRRRGRAAEVRKGEEDCESYDYSLSEKYKVLGASRPHVIGAIPRQ